MADNKVILPVRLDSYAGNTSALEAHLFSDKEEYGGKSVPDDSMWAAVHIVNGKIDNDLTDYGYRSRKELLETYKKEKIMGVRTAKKTVIDKDEIFYSLCVEDILSQAKEMKIPLKKLTPEVIKQIETRIEGSMWNIPDMIQDAISETIKEV